MFKNMEEKYLKELNEITDKYIVSQSDIEMIKKVCELETPEIRIKNSEKIEYCNQQKECCKYLYHKLYDVLEEYHMTFTTYNGKLCVEGSEDEYNHRLPPSKRTPKSIYEKYEKRQNDSVKKIEVLINKLLNEFKYFYAENGKQIKGNQGEEMVEKYFSMFSDKYPSRMNVILPIEDAFAKSSELDSVIVTPKGILVCEIKNWGTERNQVYVQSDDSWYICKNGKKEKQKNPFEQNTRHVIALEKFLKQNGIACKIIPAVIIADSKVDIINEGNNKTVLKSSAVYEYIENLPLPNTINKETQKNILNLLDNLDTEENAFPCKDIISVANQYEEAIHKVLKIRKIEYQLENELFEKCTKIINAYNFDNPVLWTIIYVCLIIVGIGLIFVFKGTIKFFIGLIVLGIVCGGFARN